MFRSSLFFLNSRFLELFIFLYTSISCFSFVPEGHRFWNLQSSFKMEGRLVLFEAVWLPEDGGKEEDGNG